MHKYQKRVPNKESPDNTILVFVGSLKAPARLEVGEALETGLRHQFAKSPAQTTGRCIGNDPLVLCFEHSSSQGSSHRVLDVSTACWMSGTCLQREWHLQVLQTA
jgi:hypothetical protein